MPVQTILEHAAARWPDCFAVDFIGKKITYRALNDLASRAAAGFQKLGVGPGVHVGLDLPNTPHYLIAFFGVMKAGGTVVNYSPLDAERVLEHKVEDSQTDLIVTLDMSALYPQMGRLLGPTRLKTLVVGNLAEMTLQPEAVRAQLAKANQLADIPGDDRHVTFEQLLDNDGHYRPHPLGDLKEAIAVLQYTGGTTGLPKGAMLTHANLSTATSQYFETTRTQPPMLEEGRERILAVRPPFHIYALSVNMLLGIRLGAELILHTRFDVEAVVKDLTTKKVSSFPGVPTMYVAIINYPGIEKADLSALKWCASSGAPLPLEVQQRFQKLTGCSLAEGWGMTETSPTGTFTPRPGKTEARLLRHSDPRHHHQIRRRRRPEPICRPGRARRNLHWWTERDAWLLEEARRNRRRDDRRRLPAHRQCRLYGRGRLCLHRRSHQGHAAVRRLQCLSAHDRGGDLHPPSRKSVSSAFTTTIQSPKAFLKLKAGAPALTLDELKSFLKDKLGKHEMIAAMELRPELPKTAVGKLSKKELYDEEAKKRAAASAA